MTENVHSFGRTSDGNWIPILVDQGGALTSGQDRLNGWSYAAAAGGITDTADVTLVAAAGVGMANFLTGAQIYNKHATTGTEVVIKAGSSVLWRGYAGPLGVAPTPGLRFDPPLTSGNNTALTAACVTTGSATLINAQGYIDNDIPHLAALVTDGLDEIFADDGSLLLSDTGATLTLN